MLPLRGKHGTRRLGVVSLAVNPLAHVGLQLVELERLVLEGVLHAARHHGMRRFDSRGFER